MQAEMTTPEKSPLTEDILDELVGKLQEFQPTELTIQRLRGEYPDIRFILCSEDDMGEKEAYKSFDDFEIFLMAGGMGCACLTDALEKSVGLVIATLEE